MNRKSTMVELVAELEKLPQTPEIAEMVAEAKAGEYHDFKNQKYDCGKIAVVNKLREAADCPRTPRAARDVLRSLSKQVINGDFDEEADAEDKKMLKEIAPPNMHHLLGLD